MILELLLVLILVGTGASAAAMVYKRAPLYTGLASLATWLVIGYASTSIDTIADDGTIQESVAAAPELSVLAFGNAFLSAIVVVAAATGSYATGEEHGTDRPYDKDEVF